MCFYSHSIKKLVSQLQLHVHTVKGFRVKDLQFVVRKNYRIFLHFLPQNRIEQCINMVRPVLEANLEAQTMRSPFQPTQA